MAVDERRRLALYDALRRSVGEDEAATLMELLPPVGWGDVATKQDIAMLAARIDGLETRIDGLETRIDGLETRIDGLESRIDGIAAQMQAGFDRQVSRLLMWLVPVMLTSTALSTAVAVAV